MFIPSLLFRNNVQSKVRLYSYKQQEQKFFFKEVLDNKIEIKNTEQRLKKIYFVFIFLTVLKYNPRPFCLLQAVRQE